jgi:beta-1,2-xylosyltransferase
LCANNLPQRGLATGLQHNKGTGARWRESHRERLHLLANNMSDTPLSVLTPVGSTGEAKETSYPAKQLSEYYMDVKMSGGPWQCDWSDGSCDEMK